MATIIWHIDRAKFSFDDNSEYEQWKSEKKVFFEFTPSQADDGGDAIFPDAGEIETWFEVTEKNGMLKIFLEEDGPVISAWIMIEAELNDDVDEDTLSDWAAEEGGWASCTIYLEYDANITEDDGGEWRLSDDT